MDRLPSLIRLHAVRAALLALLLVGLTGCGSGQGEVSGTVRYQGKPLPFGTIQLLGPDGIPRSGKIQPDGTFSVRAPAGQAKVIVACIDEARLSKSAGKGPAGQGRAAPAPSTGLSLIPPRYADWNSSGLTVEVKRGRTTQDFDLTFR